MPHNSTPRAQYVKALRDIFAYDKDTGHLIKRATGEILGKPSPTGTMRCTFMGEQTTVAQLVWMYHYGRAPVGKVLSVGRQMDKSTNMVKGRPAMSTRIEHLYDSKAHTKGYTAPSLDENHSDTQARVASANDVGISWQRSNKRFKVVVGGKYVGVRRTLDEARKLKDNYIALQDTGNSRWFGETHEVITPEKLKEAYHTDKYEYNGREYRRHAGWDKFIYGVGDNEVKGTEEQIKRYIDALNNHDDADGFNFAAYEILMELASAKEA